MSRTKRMFVVMGSVFALLVLSVGVPQAIASSYPEKPITVFQGFKAGGGSDVLAQVTQPILEKLLGKSFVNQYIPGATGAIAWTRLTKSTKKDGYTIAIINTPMLYTNYIMNPEIKYNIRELEPLANVVTDPGVMVVGKDSPYKTAQEFFAAAKASPGKLTVGNSGVGGDDFFSTLLLQKTSGMKFQPIPFQGDGPSWQAAMGGKIDASFNNLGTCYPQIKAGNLRVLAIFADKRNVAIPKVPTLKELGYDLINGSSRGYGAPKGIPADVKEKLIEAFRKMSKDPAFLKATADRALPVDILLGDDCNKMLLNQEADYRVIWNDVKSQYGKK